MTSVERFLQITLSTGDLDQQLRWQHSRWRHLWDFTEFRDAALARAWECRDQFSGDTPAEFLAWLRRIAWSVAVDHWRAERRQKGLLRRLADFIPRLLPSPVEMVETRELVGWLLAGLSERERQLLLLKYYQRLSAETIAQKLGCTTAAVNQLHYRALAKLRERLGNSDSDR